MASTATSSSWSSALAAKALTATSKAVKTGLAHYAVHGDSHAALGAALTSAKGALAAHLVGGASRHSASPARKRKASSPARKRKASASPAPRKARKASASPARKRKASASPAPKKAPKYKSPEHPNPPASGMTDAQWTRARALYGELAHGMDLSPHQLRAAVTFYVLHELKGRGKVSDYVRNGKLVKELEW